MAGAVGWERWLRALLVLGIGVTVFGVLHHIDHVVRGNHSGWPFREEVTPFTFSLLVYALLLPGIYMNLRDRVAAGWWRDPDFVTATQKQTVPVWENLRERGIDAAWWFGRMEDIANRGRAALAKDPASRFLMESLNNALENKLELMRTAAMLPSRT